jgi:type II secretory pathway pseudopilin PulG
MRRVNRFGLIAVLAVVAAVAPAFAGNVTVGRFYTEIAKAKQLTAVDASSAQASLRAAGFSVPDLALGKALTEGDVTSISNALGIKVTTSRPTELVTESQLGQFMNSFGSQLSTPGLKGGNLSNPYSVNSIGGDPGNSGNGKGKKKGHNKSTSEPI